MPAMTFASLPQTTSGGNTGDDLADFLYQPPLERERNAMGNAIAHACTECGTQTAGTEPDLEAEEEEPSSAAG